MGQLFGVRATKGKTRLNQYVFALDNLRLLQLVLTIGASSGSAIPSAPSIRTGLP